MPPTGKRPASQQGVKARPEQPDPRVETVVVAPADTASGNGSSGNGSSGNGSSGNGASGNGSSGNGSPSKASALAKKMTSKSKARAASGTSARSHHTTTDTDPAEGLAPTGDHAAKVNGPPTPDAGAKIDAAARDTGAGKANGLISAPLDPSVWATHTLTASERAAVVLPPIVPATPAEPAAPSEPAAPATRELVVLPPMAPSTQPVLVPAPEFTDMDGTDGMPSLARPIKPPRPLRKPKVVARRRPRPRVRKVTRVVRHVDSWSVFKVALVFNLFLYGVGLTSGVLLWQVAQNTGTVDNIERFFENFGWETFQLKGGEIFHNAWIAGLFVVVGLTGLAVLMATLFNLITDLVGGIRVSVLEEEVIAREDRGIGWRRGRVVVFGEPIKSTPAERPGGNTDAAGTPQEPAQPA